MSIKYKANRATDNLYHNSRPYKLVRVLILGAARVGKTSLIRTLLEQEFQDEYRPTVYDVYVKQVNIQPTNFHLPTVITPDLILMGEASVDQHTLEFIALYDGED